MPASALPSASASGASTPGSSPPGAASNAPDAVALTPPAAPASVTLVGPTCGFGPRNWLIAHTAAALVRGCCNGRCFAHAIDAAGAVGPTLPHLLGAPAFGEQDQVQVFHGRWPTAGWLAVERYPIHGPPRLAIHELSGGTWRDRYRGRSDAWQVREAVVGIGGWPGDAALAVLRADADMFPSGQRVHVLRGTPTLPPPRLPEHDRHPLRVWESLDSGHAVGVATAGERFTVLSWTPSSPEPVLEERPELRPLQPRMRGSVVLRAPDEAYVLGTAADDEQFVVVLRFDGARWTTSARLRGVVVLGFTSTPDGAVWLLTRGPGGGLWRRAPGPGDRWASVAAGTLGEDEAIAAHFIVPAGERDLLVIGSVYGTGDGVYRVQIARP